MEWISVKDNLPNMFESVLTIGADSDGEMLTPIVATIQDDGKFISGYKFAGDRSIGFYFETFPTHWMPLPSAPND